MKLRRPRDVEKSPVQLDNDEPTVKRPRFELNELKGIPIGNDNLQALIFNYIPIYQWSALELISKEVRDNVLSTYRLLRQLDIFKLYPANKYPKNWTDPKAKVVTNGITRLNLILTKLINWSPMLKRLSGFHCVTRRIGASNFEKLKEIKNLNSIIFENCEISADDFVNFLVKSPSLSELIVRNCSLDELSLKEKASAAAALASVVWLRSLTLSRVRNLSPDFWSLITACTNLTSLELVETKITSDYLCLVLKQCVNLEKLTLCAYQIPNFQPNFGVDKNVLNCILLLKRLTALRLIILFTNSTVGQPKLPFDDRDLLKTLRECGGSLREFELIDDDCLITVRPETSDRFFNDIIDGCPSLKKLRMNPTNVLSPTLTNLVKITGLDTLTLSSGKRRWGPIGFIPNLSSLENLRVLNFYGQCALQSDYVSLPSIKNLRELRLNGDLVTNLVLINWHKSKFYERLFVLEIPDCKRVSDAGAQLIAMSGVNLKSVNLSFSKITDLTIRTFAANAKKLERINVTQSGQGAISAKSLLYLFDKNVELKFVEIGLVLLRSLVLDDGFKRFKPVIQISCGE